MTREEAMEIITNVLQSDESKYTEKIDKALAVVQKALEKEPCEDLISRKELDEALYERFHEEDSPNNITDVHLGAVRNYVRNFPPVTAQQTRWIPVSERLPEYGKEVMTCRDDGYIEIQIRESTCDHWENQYSDWSDIDEVVAWMPLPEPDKAESEEKE